MHSKGRSKDEREVGRSKNNQGNRHESLRCDVPAYGESTCVALYSHFDGLCRPHGLPRFHELVRLL